MIGESSIEGWLPPVVEFSDPGTGPIEPALQGIRIGVACDNAFSFIYRANLDLLTSLGATLHLFSPLHDKIVPEVDSLYLPGGYPELYLDQLSQNSAMLDAVRSHFQSDRTIVAECGGMLYLLESLTDKAGKRAKLCGILPGDGVMQERLAGLGLHTAPLPEGDLRGHAFHHSQIEMQLEPLAESANRRAKGRGEAIYRYKGVTASYLHYYFASNIEATAKLFQSKI